MEAHLQNRQAGIVVVYGVGDFALLHSPEAVADQGQIHFFRLTQGFNIGQSQRRTNRESLMLQQQSPSCLKDFIGRNGQYFGHE